MAVTHSIGDDFLVSYATGRLSPAFDLVVATAVSLDDDARVRLAGFEAMGGALLDDQPLAPLRDDSYEQVIDRILHTAPSDTVPDADKTRRAPSILPQPLREALGGDLDDVAWTGVGMGVRQCVIGSDEGGTVRLLSIPAGQAMPDHGHDGTEVTLVLHGAYRDGEARYGRGDVEAADGTLQHRPVACEGEPCICLVATEAPLRFTALLPRVAQRFLNI